MKSSFSISLNRLLKLEKNGTYRNIIPGYKEHIEKIKKYNMFLLRRKNKMTIYSSDNEILNFL